MNLVWWTFIIALVILFFLESTKKGAIDHRNGILGSYKYSTAGVAAFAFTLIFVSGLRYGFIDTPTYRLLYQHANNWSYVINDNTNVEIGFRYLMYVLNRFSNDSQLMLIFSAIIINTCFLVTTCRYSLDKPFSLYLYFVIVFMGTNNGIRQLLAASILTLAFEWILKKKVLLYISLVCLLSYIHTSAWIMFPLYFAISGKRFNILTLLLFVFSLTSLFAKSIFDGILEKLLSRGYTSYLVDTNHGMNAIRLLVEAIPCVLVIIYFLHNQNCPQDKVFDALVNIVFINLAINVMAIQNLYFARLDMYFSCFFVIVIPLLLRKLFKHKNEYTFIKTITIILYGLYFIYQIDAYGVYMTTFHLIL